MSKTVACPNCARPVEWGPQSPYRPFCSERCRLIDLGEWLSETRRIADTEPPTDTIGPDPSSDDDSLSTH